MTAGRGRVLFRDLLGRGAAESEGSGATPSGTYYGVSTLNPPPHFPRDSEELPLRSAAAGTGRGIFAGE